MLRKGLLAIGLAALTAAVAVPASAQQVIVLPGSEPRAIVDGAGSVIVVTGSTVPVIQPAPVTATSVVTTDAYGRPVVVDEVVPAASIRMEVTGTPWCGGAYANHVGSNFGSCLR